MKRKAQILARTAFVTDRALEFFTESELTTQIGYGRALWPVVLVKELIDNALDACETSECAPEIAITLEKDAVTVADNGPGLKSHIVAKSLDYSKRISDKKYYVAPTRGQLGNALKCVWAAPFVASGKSRIEITACGLMHTIEVSLDRIAQKPRICHSKKTTSIKNGTSINVQWSGIACLKGHDENAEFYQSESLAEVLPSLIADFAAFNPHATFRLTLPKAKLKEFPASDPRWSRWRTSWPTSAHWYEVSHLRDLIAAYIRDGKQVTLRDFVGEFDGLSGTQYRKCVLDEAGLTATHLGNLTRNGDIDTARVQRLLKAMQANSRPVKPQRLGIIGKEHLQAALARRGVAPEGCQYQKVVGVGEDRLPFVVEVAFGVRSEGRRELIIGMNNAPVFKVPSGHLSDALNDAHVQMFDPVTLLIHQTTPRFMFVDHGKGAIA